MSSGGTILSPGANGEGGGERVGVTVVAILLN